MDVLQSAVALMLIGGVLLAALRVVYGQNWSESDPVYRSVKRSAWMALVFGAAVAAVVSVFGVPLFCSAVVVFCMVWVQWRRNQQQSLLSLLALAAEKGVPLPPTIDAFALEQRGGFGRRTRRLAERLRTGASLSQALQAARGSLPPSTELAVRIGTEYASLGKTLRQQVAGQSDFRPLRQTIAAQFPYLFIVLSSAPLVIAFMVIKVAPSYEKIFNDFHTPLPAITVWFLRVVNSPFMLPGLAFFSFVALLVLVSGSLWYIGWLRWLPPGFSRFLRRFDRAAILRALAFPVEQQRPLEPMLAALAVDYPSRSIRRRLGKAVARVRRGESWITSLQATGLVGGADAGVLQAAERVGNLRWALVEMADSNERRLLYRLEILARVTSVVLVALFGAITFLFAVAFFQPLVKLIWSLSNG